MSTRVERITKKIEDIKELEFPLVGSKPLRVESFYWADGDGTFTGVFQIPNFDGEGVVVFNLHIGVARNFVYNQPLNMIYNYLYSTLLDELGMDRTIIDSPLHKAVYG